MSRYNNIFEALYTNLNNINVNIGTTGFIKTNTRLPYLFINNISNSLDSKNSNLGRHELSYYQFNIYAEQQGQLLDLMEQVEEQYKSYRFFFRNNKVLNYFGFSSEKIITPKKLLFHGIIVYEILIENIRTEASQLITRVNTIEEGILDRYKNYTKLNTLISSPKESDFEKTNNTLPYFNSNSNTKTNFYTTKSRIDNNSLEFSIYSESLNELLKIKDEVENCYDYANIILQNRVHTIFDWQSSSIMELEPQLWKSSINYNILLEKLI